MKRVYLVQHEKDKLKISIKSSTDVYFKLDSDQNTKRHNDNLTICKTKPLAVRYSKEKINDWIQELEQKIEVLETILEEL